MGDYTIKIACGTGGEVFADAYTVRTKVFVGEQGIPAQVERDELDETARHVVLYDGGVPVACGRLTTSDGVSSKLGRIATLKTYRRMGCATRVCEALIATAKEEGATDIYLNAQTYATAFYKAVGFVAVGGVFYEENIPHIKMVYKPTTHRERGT